MTSHNIIKGGTVRTLVYQAGVPVQDGTVYTKEQLLRFCNEWNKGDSLSIFNIHAEIIDDGLYFVSPLHDETWLFNKGG